MESAGPQLAVVVSTRNRAGQLAEMLDALAVQSAGCDAFELVVVDDASTDETAEVLERERRRGRLRLRVIRRAAPGGAAIGRDQGWRACATRWIAFTDDDCLPDREWVAALLAACEAAPDAIVQGRTEPRPDELHRTGPFSRTIEVTALDHAFQTTNIAYPRELLERVGGFDVVAYAGAVGGEDTDLAWRAIEAGARAVFCERALVYHAVNVLGPLGLLRVAARWTAALPYARHATIRRRHFVAGLFRKPTHLWLAVALAGALLPGRLRLLAPALAVPYLRALRARGILQGGGLALAPYFLLHDLVEVWATVRGGARGGRLLI